MKILCLMPTYGRRRELLENSLACFASQTHEEKQLWIFDDLGTLENCSRVPSGVSVISKPQREASIADKYNVMLEIAARYGTSYDAVAVWDDDDAYLPDYLTGHAEALSRGEWSQPPVIRSTYGCRPGQTIIEPSAGRFHGSIAIRRELLEQLGGWVPTKRADFDQQMLAALAAHSPRAEVHGWPQYVYRWQDSGGGHCSGLMRSPDNEDWYDRYQPDSRESIGELESRFDPVTIAIVRQRSCVA